jgi:3-mercaptopyruvate sulfurtransferase SseA
LRGHIPGAGYIDTNWLERPPLWNAIPIAEMQALLSNLGIGPQSTVVLYGRTAAAAGRAAHLMLVAGVADIRLLDGGFAAWLRFGGQPAFELPHVYPAAREVGARFVPRPHYLVHTAEVRHIVQHLDSCLVSIRTWDEFTGRTSGYSYIEACGEIPGAVWGHAGEDDDINSVSALQNADGTMRPARELLALWRAAGISPQRRTIFYCGTGWRASIAFVYAWLMGWNAIGVYDGGWLEWSSDPVNPTVVHGRPTAKPLLSLPA